MIMINTLYAEILTGQTNIRNRLTVHICI